MDGRGEVDLTLHNPESDEPFALNGRYRLDAIVGHGGMGKVYRATDLVLNRPVVVKILLTEYVQEKTFIERFTREAKILSTINHPHLLVIYDYGIYAHKTPYIVSEYVEGRTLAEIVVGEGRLQVKRAVNLISQVLDALAVTHTHGIIHRDLKAENILIGGPANAEWVKVIDFGLAYEMKQRAVTQTESRITGSGLFVGTLAYMPPEQFMNENLDARTDIYSVGILLWEMLVGNVPFNAPTLERFYAKHSQESAPPFSSVTPPLPAQAMGLEPAVLKALAKRPKDRWKDATEFKLALRKAEEQTIRESIPYQAYNIKTDRVPTDRVPYPATDRFKEKPQQPAVREAKGKTAIRIRARPEEVVAKVSYRAQFIGLYEALRKAAMYLLSFVIYLVILVAVAFVVYTGYPKVKGILYPPPHVSLSVVRVALEADLVAVSLTGDAEFCKKFGKLEIETTIVATNYQKLTIGSPPNFLSKTSDGTFADFKQVTIKSQDQPITHTAYLPFDAYLQSDLQRPFRIRVRIFNGDGHLMSTFFTAPKQLAPDELPATDPVSPTES